MFEKSSEEMAVNKLMILYVLQHLGISLTNTQLTQLLIEADFFNYFELQQFLSELEESKFLISEEKELKLLYSPTELGINTLNYFLSRIPQKNIDTINSIIEKNKDKLLKQTQVQADFFRVDDNSFMVDLKILESDSTLIQLKLNVPSNKKAKEICENWNENASIIYRNIINTVIDK